MLKQFTAIFVLMAFLISSAWSQDLGVDLYDTYDPGYYNDPGSDFYNVNDDWYYDNYTVGAEEEEEILDDSSYTYDWEANEDVFADEGL